MNNQKRDFDKEAATWDDQPARVKRTEDIARAIARQVTLRPDMDVLDFGCGTGLLTLLIAPQVRSVMGVDASRGMLDVLKAKTDGQSPINVHTKHLAEGDTLSGSYDLIVSSMTFHHVEDIAPLLAQCFRVFGTPGYLCVADLDLDQGEFHKDHTGVFHHGFDRTALRALFEKAGFSNVRDVTAAEMVKPTPSGALRMFTVFLMIGEKTGT